MKMETELKKLYAEILKKQGNVSFWWFSKFYAIRDYGDIEDGYMVEVFTNEDGYFQEPQNEVDKECLTWLDGGQHDSPRGDNELEAITFALEL
jgi:hypothetical protein